MSEQRQGVPKWYLSYEINTDDSTIIIKAQSPSGETQEFTAKIEDSNITNVIIDGEEILNLVAEVAQHTINDMYKRGRVVVSEIDE